MSLSLTSQLGLAMRFHVEVDGYSLGSWSTCKGLGVTFDMIAVNELGQHAYTTNLPGRAKYTPVTLTRGMVSGDWETTRGFLSRVVADGWLLAGGGDRSASIELRDAKQQPVAKWMLRNPMPTSWKGPQLDANGQAVAVESLELIHEGFLDD